MTSVINGVLEAVIGLMNATQPFATVTRGALPTGIGLVCEIGPSSPLNGKHPNLKTLSDAMNTIHSALTRATVYPMDTNDSTNNGRWQIIDITNYTLPDIIGRENNNEWLMASSLTVKFYWKG